MHGNKQSAEQWINTAVSGIRFWLDRESVEEELRGHLEDKTADLERIFHLTHEEAEEMALKQMGDPVTIGTELARIHRPWIGRLWLVSQIMVVLLLLMTVGTWVNSHEVPFNNVKQDLLGWEYGESVMFDPWRWVDRKNCESLQVLELERPEIQVGQYTVTVEKAQLWHYDDIEPKLDEYRIVYVRFRVVYDKPWEVPGYLLSNLWAEDNAGATIISQEDYFYRNAPRQWAAHMSVERLSDRPFESVYHVIARDVSPQATEITLHYDEVGAQFALPISLEGVVVQ